MVETIADEMFREFKEHSIAEFFKKNRQMLGYSGLVRSLVTIVHEYVTNSLDACEEAGILPNIEVKVTQIGENKYKIMVADNGSGIPKNYVGKALATILSGTKFHRYIQQRGQQGIGAAGCLLFSQITTGKPIYVKSSTGNGKTYTCNILINTLKNTPVVNNLEEHEENFRGLIVEGEFADVKYENSEHGVFEYLKRTALANPHCQINFIDPDGKSNLFVRAIDQMPQRPKQIQPHPLGLSTNDLLEFAHYSNSRKITSFMIETFTRITQTKVNEIKELAKDVNLDKSPKEMTWSDAEEIIKAIKKIKWIAPDAASIIPIGSERIKIALKNIFNPDFMNVVERKPKVFRGGIPFIVEAAVAYGGKAGHQTEEEVSGNILRFANRVPLLFDGGNCAITEASKTIDWKRYNIDIENQPISIFVNISSVYIPYSGVGKEAVSKEDEIIEEIKLAIMEAARGVQNFIRGREKISFEAGRYKTIMRYAKQLSINLAEMTDENQDRIFKELEKLVAQHYPKALQKKEQYEKENDLLNQKNEKNDNRTGRIKKDEIKD
ncbi:MAG: DNA topoisomerase VI subunit B [Candidatus Marsarchaeota archaeon]|jgi:DNA topoisomerase-6 subunit B|nr:DNA topoisomerase VI subunit B [Candidatus Marsarchaeota archaeon]